MNESQMYAYRVYCNRSLIASFRTVQQWTAFINERRAKYPRNHYDDYPLSA
jgi:hypothetical protein